MLDRLHTQQLVEELFEGDLHARRVLSIANGVTGFLRAAERVNERETHSMRFLCSERRGLAARG